MALPDKQVLTRFIDDYIEIREPTWHSVPAALLRGGSQLFNSGAQVVSKLSAFFSGTAEPASTHPEEKLEELDDETAIKDVCIALKNAIAEATTMDDWANICFDLGEEARNAMRRSKTSLFCQTLQAMRTFTVEPLQKQDETFEAYTTCVQELREQKQALDVTLLKDQSANLVIDELEAQLKKLLYNLADLGDEAAIFECRRLGMFQSILFPKKQTVHQLSHSQQLSTHEVNIHKPWFYQKNYYQRYLSQVICPIKMESLTDFIARAKKNGKLVASPTERQAATAALQAAYQSNSLESVNPQQSPAEANRNSSSSTANAAASFAGQSLTTPRIPSGSSSVSSTQPVSIPSRTPLSRPSFKSLSCSPAIPSTPLPVLPRALSSESKQLAGSPPSSAPTAITKSPKASSEEEKNANDEGKEENNETNNTEAAALTVTERDEPVVSSADSLVSQPDSKSEATVTQDKQKAAPLATETNAETSSKKPPSIGAQNLWTQPSQAAKKNKPKKAASAQVPQAPAARSASPS